MVVITLNSVIMNSIYRSLLCQLDYTKDSTLHLRTLFVMWYVLSPLSSASSSSLSGVFNNNKWKNHFYEMKGDVGMSLHEKERNKKMPT